MVAAILCLPWQASVGNYGTLVAIPGQEAIIRAPENATLIALHVQPGQPLAAGSIVGRMGNLELEEQIVQAQAELARANAASNRLLGELRTQRKRRFGPSCNGASARASTMRSTPSNARSRRGREGAATLWQPMSSRCQPCQQRSLPVRRSAGATDLSRGHRRTAIRCGFAPRAA